MGPARGPLWPQTLVRLLRFRSLLGGMGTVGTRHGALRLACGGILLSVPLLHGLQQGRLCGQLFRVVSLHLLVLVLLPVLRLLHELALLFLAFLFVLGVQLELVKLCGRFGCRVRV